MEKLIDYRNPCFFDEVNYLLQHRLHADLAYEAVFRAIVDSSKSSNISNKDIEALLHFGSEVFDTNRLSNHTVAYLRVYGKRSREILNLIERLRFELRLLDDEHFELEYGTLCLYLEFIIAANIKLEELEHVFLHEMKYLSN